MNSVAVRNILTVDHGVENAMSLIKSRLEAVALGRLSLAVRYTRAVYTTLKGIVRQASQPNTTLMQLLCNAISHKGL